jgi:hypothetical protein
MENGRRHYSEVDLAHSIEHRPAGPHSYDIPGVVNHSTVVRHVLERTGHSHTAFRAWRSAVTYPGALVELVWTLTHPSR